MKYLLIILATLIGQHTYTQVWQQMGPEGGYFKEFTFDPTNSDIIYVGSDDGGGVWKSIDAGNSWDLTTFDFPNMTGWKVVIDENSTNTIYACDLYGRYGLLKSNDAANSWSEASIGLTTTYDRMVSGIVVKTADTLFISTGESSTSTPVRPGNGIFKSYDGGLSWLPAGLQGMTCPSIGKNEFGTIFAGSEENGLFYSNDNGTSWLLHPDIPDSSTVFEIQTESNVLLLASTEGVFLSSDWGITFNLIGLVGEFNFDACIHKTSPNIEIYSSTLTGLKHYSSATGLWTLVPGVFFNDQLIIGITSDGNNIYCGGFSNSPILKSSDGGLTWAELNQSPTATEINDIYIDPLNGDRIFASLMGTYNLDGDFDRDAIYATIDGGLNWVRKGPDAHGLCLTVNPLNSNEFYLGSFAQGVYKTTDNFDTFTQLSIDGVTVVDVIVSIEDTSVILISEFDFTLPLASIKRSVDGGANFTTVSSQITNRLIFNPNNNDTVYAATNNGVHLSTDFGLTFSPWILSGEDCLTIKSLGSELYVGTADGKLYKISNGVPVNISGSWSTPVELKSILVENNHLFVGLNGAEKDTLNVLQGSVWQSDNGGASWNNITTNMTSTNVYGNNIIVSDGSELYIGTYGGGIFKSSGLTLSVDENINKFGVTIFPNPTSDIVYIESNHEIISDLKLFTILGKDITSTVKTGMYGKKAMIDLSNFSTGIYIIKINGIDSKRVFVK